MTVTAGLLPGNLLTQVDSDFETGIGSWNANANASALAQSPGAGFTGNHALAWTVTANGNSAVQTGLYACQPSTPHVASLWVRPPASLNCYIGVGWFNGAGFLSLTNGPVVACGAATWTPLTFSGGSPSNANNLQLFCVVEAATGGTFPQLDLAYVAPSVNQTLIAWGTPPLSLSPLFADMTPFTRADQSIAFTRGRPDETSTVQPGNATLTLDNQVIAGAFSQGNANSPFPVQLSSRMQVNFADEAGAWHTRFDGTITDLVPGWNGGPGLESTVQVTANGLMAWLARNPGPTLSVLRTLIEEEMLADSPLVLYALSDKTGSTSAADESGNSAAALTEHRYSAGSTLTFGNAGQIIGSSAAGFSSSVITAASFSPNATVNVNAGYQLEGPLPQTVTAAAGFSFEIWYELTGAGAGIEYMPVSVANSQTGQALVVALSSQANQCYLGYLSSPRALSMTLPTGVNLPAATGQVAVTVSGTTATLYLNGSSVSTITVPAGFTANYLTVGGPNLGPRATIAYVIGVNVPSGWAGQLNCAAVWPSALSAGRISAHWTAGSVQNQGQNINTLIANTLAYAGIPSAFYSVPATGGVSFADAYDATGQNPLAMIQLYQQTDGGVFYEAANGKLTWQDRAARYGNQVTPALTLSGGQYEPDLTYPLTTQYLINDAVFANNNIPAGIRAVNTGSVSQNGTYANGTSAGSQFTNTSAPSSLTSTTAGSPLTGPWYSYPYQPGTVPSPDVLTDAANWQVNISGTPVPRSPTVTIDLASALGTGSQVSRAAVFATDIGSVIKLTGLPPTAPAGSRVAYLMVEGADETFTRDDSGVVWTLTFNTSPASQSAAWVPGDASLGILDSTAVVGRGTDGASQSGTEYAGPPYPVPTFGLAMNRTGNVGANDMRGLTSNTTLQIYPPCATVQQVSLGQSINNTTNTAVQFDTIWYDTRGGWTIPTNVTTYTVQLPGLYKLTGSVVFAANATGDRSAWFEHNGVTVAGNEQGGHGTQPNGVFVSAQVQCAQGDTLQLWCSQASGGALALVTTNGGPVFSILWIGT